jgi:DNA invertase Pin-like site-specific DNA recombinase
MATFGYARVSTLDQDLTVQQQVLRAAGCGVVHAEKASGARRDDRTELQVLLDFVQPGDTDEAKSRGWTVISMKSD